MADLRSDFRRHQITQPVLAGFRAADRQGLQRRARVQGGLGRRGVEDAGRGSADRQRVVALRRRSTSTATRMAGFTNIELITDRPLEVNLREIKQVKRDWPDRALIVSLMVPCEEESGRRILARVEDTGADGVELNFGCPHGMCERGMGSAVGQVPDYVEMVTRWCKAHTRMPVIVKLTPNVTNILGPARAAKRGGADAVSLINTVSSIIAVDLDRMAPTPDGRRQGHAWRLLRAGGEADRAAHGGRDRARRGVRRPADLRHRRHRHLARRGGVHGAGRRHRAGLHGGHALRLQDRRGHGRRADQLDGRRRATRGCADFVGKRGAQRHRLAVSQHELQDRRAASTRRLASSAGSATSPARIRRTRRSRRCVSTASAATR